MRRCAILIFPMMNYIYIGCLFYACIWLFTLAGLIIPYRKNDCTSFPSVTILIVARNEALRLPLTLASLQTLDLTGIRAEFIFVNDCSTDDTLTCMQQFTSTFPVHILTIDTKNPLLPGKKDGITRAVAVAHGEIIIMTDADSVPQPRWVQAMLRHFTPSTVMLLGHVRYAVTGIHSFFANIEALCGSIFTFSWARFNNAPYCRGANLAFRKDTFIRAKGYEGMPPIASGDDMFLLQKLRHYGQCRPVFDQRTFVSTSLHTHVSDHIEQQKRKYAKNFRYEPLHQILFVGGLLFHFLLFTGLFTNTVHVLHVIAIKTACEYMIFCIGASRLGAWNYLPWFPFFILVYPFEVIIFSLWGAIKGYRWKSDKKIR